MAEHLHTTVVTLNCQGLRDRNKRSVLFSWLNCCKPDIVCLQETHSISKDEFASWVVAESTAHNNLSHYSVLSSPGSNRSRGVAILFKPFFTVDHDASDADGRLQIATFTMTSCASSSFQVACLYGPNQKVPGEQFFASLHPQLDAALPLIVCGDFNTVVDPLVDRFGCNPSSHWAYNWPSSLRCLTEHFTLTDIWRDRHPDLHEYTWRRANGSQKSRLDMFWISPDLVETVSEIDILPFFSSDHSSVFLRFSVPGSPERGKGVWKMNTSLLKDDAFCTEIRAFWSSWQQEKSTFPSLDIWWEAGKRRLKRLIKQYSRQTASSRRTRITALEATLKDLGHRENKGEDVAALIREINDQLKAEHLHRAEGAKVRARQRWAEEGETSSSFFFRLEKTQAVRRLFSGIRNTRGMVVRSLHAITRVLCLFYMQLFSAVILSPSDQTFFLNSLTFSLSATESALCDGEISVEECFAALQTCANNKSPGIDGLPYEFFHCFWDILGVDVAAVFNVCVRKGSLSASQRTGLITLIYKKDDRLDPKNWRPITLLCCDYKILSKVLTLRLKSVISSVVSSCQSCGVPGRFSGENVRLLQDIVNYANHADIGGTLLSLDQEKAFDRIDWNFMLSVLEKMNFGKSFCSWVRLLYSNIFSCILVNGHVSDVFKVTRGVRQGCPLSPLLYILVTETLAQAIQQDSSIDGFFLPNKSQVKICQYADDTTILVRSDAALLSLFRLFQRYELASGAKLNVSKSHGLLFGSWRARTDLPITLKWSNLAITVLGCRIGNSEHVDWDTLMERFSDLLLVWKQRQLSFRGRALISNVLGLSIFWYQATIFDMPKTVMARINKILFPFVWNKKREWMARSSVVQPLSLGGLGVVDIATKVLSLRAVWIRRFFSDPSHPWSTFFRHHVAVVFGQSVEALLARTIIPAYKIKQLPSFYASVIRSWVGLKGAQADGAWVVPRPSGCLLALPDLTAKIAYSTLRSRNLTEHRSLAKFRDLGIVVHWPEVWASLNLWRYVRPVQDTAWLTFHGISPTADRLLRFGMHVDPLCFCGLPEDLLHLLSSCWFAQECFRWFLSLLQKFRPTITLLSPSETLFGFPTNRGLPVVFSALLGVLRHHIWLARNAYRFDNVLPHTETTLHKAKATFRFLLRMHHRHHPRDHFSHDWLADGVIGVITARDSICFSSDFVT